VISCESAIQRKAGVNGVEPRQRPEMLKKSHEKNRFLGLENSYLCYDKLFISID
jgi:hypothetical protein